MSGFLVKLCRFMCFQLFYRLETHGCTISSMKRLSKSSNENHSNQTSYSWTIVDHHTDDIKHLTTVKDLILMFFFVGQRLKSSRTSTEKTLDSNRFWKGKTRNCFLRSSSAHWRSGTRRTECVWGRWDECLRTGTWSLQTTVNWFPVTVYRSVYSVVPSAHMSDQMPRAVSLFASQYWLSNKGTEPAGSGERFGN